VNLGAERILNSLTVGVGHMSPGSRPPKPPKLRFWIRLGAATFFLISINFLTLLSLFISPLTFAILFPTYLIFVLIGFWQMRAIEIALAKAEAEKRLSQPSHPGQLDQQAMCQTRELYEQLEEYEPEVLKRKFVLVFSIGIAVLVISWFYGVLPQPSRILSVPLVLFAAWYLGKHIGR
jgi:hypothetical protein